MGRESDGRIMGEEYIYSKPPLGSLADQEESINDDLVAWWVMNEGSGSHVNDISGNSNHGTTQADTAWVGGIHGPALSFDGTGDYVDAGNDTFGDSGFSVATWFMSDDVTNESRLYARGSNSGNNPTVQIITGGIRGIVGAAAEGGGGQVVGSSVAISNDIWYHVVMTFDKIRMKLYINGVEEADDAAATNIGITTETVFIGASVGTLSPHQGDISDVRVWSRTLTASDVQQLYTQQLKGIADN